MIFIAIAFIRYKYGEMDDMEFWERAAKDDLSQKEDFENESEDECDPHHVKRF
jgi:hypothetical protein